MPTDPVELERLRLRLVQLEALQHAAARRAADPPLIGPEAWRGPAYRAYAAASARLAARLSEQAGSLAHAVELAREEFLRALV